jgi:ketosteroid isomerase-like protein
MNSDHVTFVQQVYDAFARGDVPGVLGAFDAGIEWREAEGFPYADGNPYVGPNAVLQGIFGRIAAEWDNFTVQPHEALPTPDGAVVLGRYSGTFKATGRRVDAQFAHVWRIQNGKVRGFQQYTDTAQFDDATRR